MKKTHWALYGGVDMLRGYCKPCRRQVLILSGNYACCDRPADLDARVVKRMSGGTRRRRPSAEAQLQILQLQDYRCIYCERSFGSIVWKGEKEVELKLNWDHSVPYSYTQDSTDPNFVAACHLCNAMKHSKLFRSLEDAKVYIAERAQRKAISAMPPLPGDVPPPEEA